MICKKCGNEINENDKFCENCGNDLTKKSLVEMLKEYRKQLLAIFIIIVIILAGLFGYQYYNSHKKFVNPYYKITGRIGVNLEKKDEQIIIGDILKDSPASNSKLQKGDIILKVDKYDVKNIHENIIYKISGPTNTPVKLTILRGGKNYTYTIMRSKPEDYYEYYPSVKIYTKYLKYADGKYYFWERSEKDALEKLYGIKNAEYCDTLKSIDIKNQVIGILEVILYDKNGKIITHIEDSNKESNIKPQSIWFILYKIFKRIDDNSSDKEKEQFKGFLE